MSSEDLAIVYQYHDGTKHRFERFAQSLGYLDWASQPKPFRSFAGAPAVPLYPRPDAPGADPARRRRTYDELFARSVAPGSPVTPSAIGYVLRHALGLSAGKAFRGARWSLRVNPSSGNLHPTEAYLVTGPIAGLGATSSVWHYAADRHALEERSTFPADAWRMSNAGDSRQAFLVALTSIHWRESWKYGERAFRYCQHDMGHAIAALSCSAALCGWQVSVLPAWSHQAVATLTGIDRDEDYVDAEREEPACVLLVTAAVGPILPPPPPAAFLAAIQEGQWFGHASQLSEEHVAWRFIDQVARATSDPGRADVGTRLDARRRGDERAVMIPAPANGSSDSVNAVVSVGHTPFADRQLDAPAILLQRRSAVGFDGASSMEREPFLRLLSRIMPGPEAPWDALWWSPRIHVALLIHRVTGIAPGLYLLVREASALAGLRAACHREFRWEPAAGHMPLWLLQAGDYRSLSRRVSCDQDIASDGFFSLGMIAEFDASLREEGPSFYRHLFWESGVVGQVLYLEAEAAGVRATGIGCFYDDPVHELLGLESHAFQSLYHFTVGMPVEDVRLTTEPGYVWERRPA